MAMTPRLPTRTFKADDDLWKGLEEVRDRDGITIGEQIRRAISDWLEKKGVTAKTERKRARTRKRS
jgi:hypothetical protein